MYIYTSSTLSTTLSFYIFVFYFNVATVKSCHIAFGADNAVGTATYGGIIQKTYSCVVNEAGYSGVHVVGIYEGNSNIIPFGDVNIYVSSSEEKPLSVILVLVSHEPVNWVLYVSYGVTVKRVLLVRIFNWTAVTWLVWHNMFQHHHNLCTDSLQ